MTSPASGAPVLLPFPTEWDLREFADPRATRAAGVLLLEPRDEDVGYDFDVSGFVQEIGARHACAGGVFASSDYPGAAVAALLARRLGLPGPDPLAVLRAAHKYAARVALAAAVPEAVPRFALVDPFERATWRIGLDFPCFVKPVKGSYSIHARTIGSQAELETFLAEPALQEYCRYFVRIFDRLVRAHGVFERGAGFVLAEELLRGEQVTVEGWVQAGAVGFLGVVDTHFHPGTRSFARFEYPSAHAPELVLRMQEVVARAVLALGLDHTLFNAELIVDPRSGHIGIVEVNPRMCGQFADLYAKVDGTSGYAVACAVARGERVSSRARRGPHAVAASVPLRAFECLRVRAVPDAARLRALEERTPGTRLWLDCRAGDVLLASPGVEDGWSQRYAVMNLGAGSRAELLARAARLAGELGIELERPT